MCGFWEHTEAECDTHSFAGGSGEVVSSERKSSGAASLGLKSVALSGVTPVMRADGVYVFAELLAGVRWISKHNGVCWVRKLVSHST